MIALPHTLVFVRHGETDWNVELRFQGQRDTPINARGREQARRNGEVLSKVLPEARDFEFVSSPLQRARETIEIMRGAMGLPPAGYRLDPVLVEMTYGAWEGFTLEELGRTGPETVAARQADKWGYAPPSGESYAMLSARVEAWVRSIDRDMVVVSHGAVGRCLRGLLLPLATTEIPLLTAPQDQFLLWRGGTASWH